MSNRRKGPASSKGLPWPLGVAVCGLAIGLAVTHDLATAYLVHEGLPVIGVSVSPMVQDALVQFTSMVVLAASISLALLSAVSVFKSRWRTAKRQRSQSTRMHKARHAAESAMSLDVLDWRDFEYLVGHIFKQQGYRVDVQEGSRDGGYDLLMVGQGGQRLLVQCKHWKSTKVGAPSVRELAGTVMLHKAHAGALVCSGTYTRDARKEADFLGIELYDGAVLRQHLRLFES